MLSSDVEPVDVSFGEDSVHRRTADADRVFLAELFGDAGGIPMMLPGVAVR
jgi:hypothetical protein